MNQTVGIIELDAVGTAAADLFAPADDATLDELFARLIHGHADDDDSDADGTLELAADLDLLYEDLSRATRQTQHAIFLARGSRR